MQKCVISDIPSSRTYQNSTRLFPDQVPTYWKRDLGSKTYRVALLFPHPLKPGLCLVMFVSSASQPAKGQMAK
jgi:hypothetical protein